MSHEKSISVEVDGKFVNLRTVGAGGRRISQAEAVRMFKAGEMNALGNKSFPTMRAAVAAAERRSPRTQTPRRNPFRNVQ